MAGDPCPWEKPLPDGRIWNWTTAGVTYTYDGDGKRVKKTSGTLYWYGMSAVPMAETDLCGNTTNEYVFFAGGRIARRNSAGSVFYYFPDHLGSSRSITNATGAICYEGDFYPFGGERVISNTCAQNFKFTGMERDSETGNDHTWFRSYASNLGRWLSPDPLAGSVFNPQSLNRYAYVLNNPTNFIDPPGLGDENCTWVGTPTGGELRCPAPPPTPTTPSAPYTIPAGCMCDWQQQMLVCPPPEHPTEPGGAVIGAPEPKTEETPVPEPPDNRPYCADIFTNELLGGVSPSPSGEAIEQTAEAGAAAAAGQALKHQVERGLVVPLRSSIVRSLLLKAEVLSFAAEMTPWVFLGMEVLPAVIKSSAGSLKGECKGVF